MAQHLNNIWLLIYKAFNKREQPKAKQTKNVPVKINESTIKDASHLGLNCKQKILTLFVSITERIVKTIAGKCCCKRIHMSYICVASK